VKIKQKKYSINGPKKIKLPLRFYPESEPGIKEYFIYILKNKSPWQKISIKAKYGEDLQE
jgi:hypothetical protein